MTDQENQITIERNEISEIIAKNFKLNDEQYDASDFEWSAYQVQEAGYRKERQGKWYKHDKKKHGDTLYHCSVCEKIAPSDCMIWELTDYCPNCGAKMRGE